MRQNSCTSTRTGADKYMKEFFCPNKAKILLASRLCIGLLATLMLKIIPPQFDILDLREIPNLLANLFGRWPIRLFDMLTASQFAAKGGGFLVFPSFAQILFMLVLDALMIYLISCLIMFMKKRKG